MAKVKVKVAKKAPGVLKRDKQGRPLGPVSGEPIVREMGSVGVASTKAVAGVAIAKGVNLTAFLNEVFDAQLRGKTQYTDDQIAELVAKAFPGRHQQAISAYRAYTTNGKHGHHTHRQAALDPKQGQQTHAKLPDGVRIPVFRTSDEGELVRRGGGNGEAPSRGGRAGKGKKAPSKGGKGNKWHLPPS